MMGFGASTLILGNIAGKMIGLESVGWRTTYFMLGIAIGVILLITSMVMKLPSAGAVFPQPKAAKKAGMEEDFAPRDYTTGEMVRRFTFWRFFIFAITASAVGNTVISFARDLVMSVGATAALATTMVGVLSVCNGLGRILCGLTFDAIGRRRTMLLAVVVTMAAASVILIAVLSGSLAIGILGLCVTGLSYGCLPTISSAFTAPFMGANTLPPISALQI
jgi:OFA family oxalate/formate antiporter-like MFS transporter